MAAFPGPARPVPLRARIGWAAFVVAALLAIAGLTALGVWQIERREWKLALIERVERRVNASPVDAPSPAQWPALSADDEYRRVRLHGRFLHAQRTLVQASTALGSGFWVMTPLQADDGSTVLVNRGFVASAQAAPPAGQARASQGVQGEAPVWVVGLLRTSEPGGGFLRRNDPAGERWFSRDVRAIAQARGLKRVAPYFVDAQALQPALPGIAQAPAPAAIPATAQAPAAALEPPGRADTPVAGLTVIAFRNHHMVYALTWFALAAMMAAGAGYVIRDGWRRHRHGARLDPAD